MELDSLDLNKVYTYADYFKWQFEERVELLKGKIFKMSPALNRFHQELTGYVYTELSIFLRKKQCKVYVAPFDVRLPQKSLDDNDITTALQPDVCVVCDPAKLDKRGCIGAPDIVVEVLSPGNNAKEIKNKYDIYEAAGVKEYWIVSPQDQTFTMHILTNGKYVPCRTQTTGDVVSSTVLPGFALDLTDLFGQE